MMPFENASKVVGVLEDDEYFRLLVTYSTKDTDAVREMLGLLQEREGPGGFVVEPAKVVERTEDYFVLKVDPDI
jgi:hypothetical protein